MDPQLTVENDNLENHRHDDSPDVDKSAESGEGKKRITVDLVLSAQEDLQNLCKKRGISITEAVRRSLALFDLCDPDEYDLILRPKDRTRPDEIVHLI